MSSSEAPYRLVESVEAEGPPGREHPAAVASPPRQAHSPQPPPARLTVRARQWIRGFIWAGLVVTAAGFGLIAYAWGRVAGLTDVALQLPFVVSGGFIGLALVLVGLTAVNAAVKRRDALARERQLQGLEEVLAQLLATVDEAERLTGGETTGEPEEPPEP